MDEQTKAGGPVGECHVVLAMEGCRVSNGEVGVVPGTGEHQLHLFCAQPVLRVLIVANSFLFWHKANLLAGCRRPVEAGSCPTVSHSTL